MIGDDVIVLEVYLDEGLPVLLELQDFDAVEHVAGEIEVLGACKPGEVLRHVAFSREQHAAPVLQRGLAEVEAVIFGEVRRAEQFAIYFVSTSVQRAAEYQLLV